MHGPVSLLVSGAWLWSVCTEPRRGILDFSRAQLWSTPVVLQTVPPQWSRSHLPCALKCVPAERAGSPEQFLPETGEQVRRALGPPAALALQRSVHAPRCALRASSLSRHAALAHLHEHRRIHNCADELRCRTFCVRHNLNLKDQSLCHHGHLDSSLSSLLSSPLLSSPLLSSPLLSSPLLSSPLLSSPLCGQTLNNDGLLSVWFNDEDCLA